MKSPLGNMICTIVFFAGVVACTSMGTGVGNTRNGAVHANFAWQSTGDRAGTLNAEVSNGQRYAGPYFQVTTDSRIETLTPLWNGWNSRWEAWGPQPDTAFITHYTGKVVANLENADGDHMRCHFRLMRPSEGMAGGGQGACQLPSGETIDATFAHS
ncbi:MAG: hypothetical protein ACJ8OJ_17610 [Povalibacter sp.]